MMNTMTKFFAATFLLAMLQTAWAIELGDAKAQGLVGESNSGYLAAVKTPASAEVRALIVEVNTKRKEEFERTAEKTGATVVQVAYRFYELAVQKTAPGNYYQDVSGNWQRK
jgi:uncharacterized protein YdbL (DUF1318 family)